LEVVVSAAGDRWGQREASREEEVPWEEEVEERIIVRRRMTPSSGGKIIGGIPVDQGWHGLSHNQSRLANGSCPGPDTATTC
jgi:hypothetical protein